MAQLGFVGLGAMGSRVAGRLLAAGHTLTGYNRTRAKAEALLQAGMQWADSPRAVVQAAEVTFSMVTNTAVLQDIADQADGVLAGLASGKVWVDMSTVSPFASRELAQRVAAKGAFMFDAPVSGSPSTVEQGSASIMVAGDEAAYKRIEPILHDIAPKVNYLGGNGLALVMKLASNINLAVQMLAFSEGVLLAEKNGIPRKTAVEVLLNSTLASTMLKYRGPFVLELPDPAWFDVKLMQKDLLLALEVGRASGVPLPTSAVTNEFLTAARAGGLGDEDFAAVFQVLARFANAGQDQ
jgi:3-hydroxyisobutyrate dehydrogenase-like beta-hydroxyacid dehydrogenase